MKIKITALLLILFSSLGYAQVYNMDNSDETTCFGYFYDSGGTLPNIGAILGCITQGTYENNEDFEKTFCSDNGQNLSIVFDELDLVGAADYLDVYDGPDTGSPLLFHFTSASGTQQIVSSGTCLTFVFHSGNNGTDWMGCDDGGDWAASISCIDVYQIDTPITINTCNAIFVDDGGISGQYSENQTLIKTICPAGGNCVKINFSSIDLGTGEELTFYTGNSASGSPLMTIGPGDPIPPFGIGSEQGDCLTIKFTSDGDGNVGDGWMATLFCPPTCGTIPECTSNDPAGNQCSSATPICNLDGYCGSTDATYTSTNPNGDDWNSIEGLMDDFCGSIENNSWLSFIADATTATLNVWTFNCANNEGVQMQVYETSDCLNFTPVSNCVSYGYPSDFSIEATGLTPGNTYYLMIDGFAGDNCDYIISAASGIDVGAEITQAQVICPGDVANISIDGVDTTTTSFEWFSVPVDPTLAGQENEATVIVSPTDTTTYYCAISGPSPNPLCGPISDTLETMIFVLDAAHSYCNLDVSCNVEAIASDSMICSGQDIVLSADGSINVSLLANDFNDGSVGINWAATTEATFTNPCSTGPDGIYLWMGNASPATRQLVSQDFDVTNGGNIGFYLKYAVQGDFTPCEGPDEPDEGVSLQFSTDYGANWTDIAYFNPYTATIEASNPGGDSPTATGPTIFTSWDWYEFILPGAAQTGSTRFRWVQIASTTLDNDHWGLDSIIVTTPPPGVTYSWSSDPAGYTGTGTNPPTANPTVTTDYIVTASADIEGDTYSCTDTVHVEVIDIDAGFSVNDPEQCLIGNSFSFTNSGSTGSDIQYSWDFGGDGTSTAENPTHNFSTNGTYVVSQTVTYNGMCPQTYSMNVTIYDDPTVTFSPSIESCYMTCDGTITANPQGTGPFTFSWSNGQTTQTAVDLCGDIYTLTVTDANLCSATDSYTLDSRAELLIDSTGSNSTLCYGYSDGSAYVEATGGTGVGTYSYLWDLNASNQNTQTAGGLSAGLYDVTITDANDCSISTSVEVEEPTQVSTSTSGAGTICNGQNTIISAIPSGGNGSPYTVAWSTMPPTVISNDQSMEINPTNTTTYYVLAYDEEGCVSPYDTVKVTVLPPLNLNLYSEDSYVCPGESATINMNFNGGTGGPYFLYQIDGVDQSLIIPPIEHTPEQSDSVIVALRDGCSTPDYDTIEITVLPIPPVSILAIPNAGCQPLKVKFYELTEDMGQKYVWDFGENNSNNNLSILKNPEHEYDNWGTYDVSVQITSDSGCVYTQTEEELIKVYRTPLANFYPNDLEATRVLPRVYFENHTNALTDLFNWDFGDFSEGSDDIHPTHTYAQYPQEYEVTLIATNPLNQECADTTSRPIKIKEVVTFYAPSAFTPEGSHIPNREFRVFAFGIQKEFFHMAIYDRWGEKIFETFNYDHAWDGKGKGGKYVQNGVYSWIVKYVDIFGNAHEESGSVTVIR